MSHRPKHQRDPNEVRIDDICRTIYRDFPEGPKPYWGRKLADEIDGTDDETLAEWKDRRLYAELGEVVSKVKVRDHAHTAPKITYQTEAMRMTPTISVRTPNGRQLKLWYEVSPAQWVEAARRLHKEARGRLSQAELRIGFAAVIENDPALMALPTIAAVAARMGWDLTDLDLGAIGQ